MLNCILDRDSFDEFQADFAQEMIVGHARICGISVGIIANNRGLLPPASPGKPPRFGGIIYTESAEKTAYFIETCNRHGTPLVFIQDVSGFMVGVEAEQSGIIRAGAKLITMLSFRLSSGTSSNPEVAAWEAQAAKVTITRDDWGIAHVHGADDGAAVFGMIYAQAEDDFPRIEANYLTALGRLAEAEGEPALWSDLRARLWNDPDELQALWHQLPRWLGGLTEAWAEGLNAYLLDHPEVHPRVLTRFEPWMALAFTEGSIGGDVERADLTALAAFYGDPARAGAPRQAAAAPPRVDPRWAPPFDPLAEPTGSNGFAIAPARTAGGHPLLLINPHTSFYFRAELGVSSDAGLDAYGAVTWGQFFVYQGFNSRVGWMHTSTGADAVDEYAETIVGRGEGLAYRYAGDTRPLITRRVELAYRTPTGLAHRAFTTYHTHHGPIVRSADDRWIALRLMHRPIEALSQSYLRTKAHDLASFRAALALAANSSNNTIYADADGHIAYFHPQFIPRRDDRFDWSQPVDGSDPATEWAGVHGVDDSPHVVDPPTGWVMNTNDWPYAAAGPDSPRADQFPRYMDRAGENPRGVHAARVLADAHALTLRGLRDAAYDPYLPAFATLVPQLLAAYDALPAGAPARAALAAPIASLRAWDLRWAADSIATTVAVRWGMALATAVADDVRRARVPAYAYLPTRTTPAQQLAALTAAIGQLTADFGRWQVAWGEVNRFQRVSPALAPTFSDAAPSLPVPFTSGEWGSLASFGARTYPGTRRLYGSSGNSFVAVVELAEPVRALAITAGGASGDPASPHFADQAARYAAGDLREVYVTPAQLAARPLDDRRRRLELLAGRHQGGAVA